MLDTLKKTFSFIPLTRNSLTIIGLFIILLAIPLTVFLAQQQQEIRQRAATVACSGNACTDCILNNRPDILPFYEREGWDTGCENQNNIVDNWCGIDSSGCQQVKTTFCSSSCATSDRRGIAILLGRAFKTSPQYAQCLEGRFYLGDNCGNSQCHGAPNYTVTWSQEGRSKTIRNEECFPHRGQDKPRYTFEHTDNPLGDADGENVTVTVAFDGDVSLRGWNTRTSNSAGRTYPGSEQTGAFANPGPNQTFTVRVYRDGGYKWNHLWFWDDLTLLPSPTPTPTPTPTPPSGTTSLEFSLRLQGIGGPTSTPRNLTRQVKVEIFDTQNRPVPPPSRLAGATYQNGVHQAGHFKGTLNLDNFTTGPYVVKLKVKNTLRRLPENITNIIAGQTNRLPIKELVSGDLNDDNELNAVDYALLVGCLEIKRGKPGYSCPNPSLGKAPIDRESLILADLNDDGIVNTQDLSILIFNFSHRQGD